MTVYDDTLAETLNLLDGTLYLFQVGAILSETLNINDAAVQNYVSVLLEVLDVGDNLSGIATLYSTLSESLELTDAVNIAFDQFLSEPFTIADATVDKVTKLIIMIEALQLADVITSNHTAGMIAAEVIGIYDSLEKFLEASVIEVVNLTDSVIESLLAAHFLVEAMTIADTTTSTLTIILVNTEQVNVNDSYSISSILQGILEDGFQFITSFDYGEDVYTGWVMNSENFAVTNYDNYNFNSFCKFDDKYYGAGTAGVFLLEGSKDGTTTYIDSLIRTGRLDFETSNLKNIPQAYIGFTGDGEIVLKVKTDADLETWYNLESSDTGIHTDRISLAKGQIGRYWQFELVTQNNTDLELDTIELFPIILKRKV